MSVEDRWLLPEGIDEALPAQAARLEAHRRELLDLYRSWGYELIMPPLIEYLDSLLIGAGSGLELETFKVTDSISGRLLGVRADVTPQAARIDAHRLPGEGVRRLCYIATVLRSNGDQMSGSRSPLQLGAEIFGHGGMDSDVEVIRLMLATLHTVDVGPVHLDLGHVGIYRDLARLAGLSKESEAALFGLLQHKAIAEIEATVLALGLAPRHAALLIALAQLAGDSSVLCEARKMFASVPELITHVDYLESIAAAVTQCNPEVELHFDLAELRGYHYKTGAVFAAFVPGLGKEVARGGRYDEIGKYFGRARPATGFSADLKQLAAASNQARATVRETILVSTTHRDAAKNEIARRRRAGECVVIQLDGEPLAQARVRCSHSLQPDGASGWVLTPLLIP